MSAQKTITIQGLQFEVAEPYEPGHQITEAEAKALNQVRHENIRNNMARVIKGYLKTEDGAELSVQDLDKKALAEIGKQVSEYDASYEFTLASVGQSRRRDPVETEANRIARAAISAKLRADGRKISDVEKDVLDAAVEKLAGSEKVMAQAAANVQQRNAIAEGAMDDLDL